MVLIQLTPTRTPGCDAADAGSNKTVCVEQGPDWLAALLYGPPWWVYVALALVGVGALALAVYAHRVEPLGRQDLRDALGSVAIVAGCGLGAWAMQEIASTGYLTDLAVGWAVGGAVGIVVARHVRTDDPSGEDAGGDALEANA